MPQRLQMDADGDSDLGAVAARSYPLAVRLQSPEVRLPPMWENHGHLNPFPEDDEAKRREMEAWLEN